MAAEHTAEGVHSSTRSLRASGVRRRSVAFESLQPNAALHAYAAALDVASDAVAIVDRTGRVVHANQAAEALIGCSNLTGRSLTTLCTLEPRQLRAMLRDLQERQLWRGHLTLATRSGPRPVSVSLRTVSRAHGRPHHFCVGINEATDATPALSTVGRVAGEMAHDFNNQIAVVLNYSFILLRQLPHGSPLRDHVAEMQSAAWHASALAQDMLQFAGPRCPESDEIDLNALLQDVRAVLEHTLPEGIRIERMLATDLWHVRARRAHLEWLLVELIGRIRSTLGPVKHCAITTRNADVADQSARMVWIYVEATPCADTVAAVGGVRRGERRAGPGGAELALSHLQGELSVEQLPDGGLRYGVCLPAL